MLIYHYSLEPREELLSPLARHGRGMHHLSDAALADEEAARRFRGDPFPRTDSLSFLLDELPLDLIRTAPFAPDHKAYRLGTELFCHVIDTATLPACYWELVETPLDIWLRNHLWLEWLPWKRLYFCLRRIIKRLVRYQGYDHKRMVVLATRFHGETRSAFASWIASPEFVEERHMYAANVPHLILTPLNHAAIKSVSTHKVIV